MPYNPPDDQAPGEDAPKDAHTRYEERQQELQVRLTAQRILSAHLNPKAAKDFWNNIDLNLHGAHLHYLNLTDCHVRKALFNGARFTGPAGFLSTKFEDAQFFGATFAGYAWFAQATFTTYAGFLAVTFTEGVVFTGATFAGGIGFHKARVARPGSGVVLPTGWIRRY